MDQLKQLTASLWQAARERRLVLLETETAWFVLMSALDFAVTLILLNQPGLNNQEMLFFESNPIAAYFLNRWGIKGLLFFKAFIVGVVVLICQFVARHNALLARRVLFLGTAIVSGVVIYSVLLHQSAVRAAG